MVSLMAPSSNKSLTHFYLTIEDLYNEGAISCDGSEC